MTIKILHIMGTKEDGTPLEILAVDPCPENEPEDYITKGETIEESQVIELVGNWPSCPRGTTFEREVMF